jgi:hypothetical protein
MDFGSLVSDPFEASIVDAFNGLGVDPVSRTSLHLISFHLLTND